MSYCIGAVEGVGTYIYFAIYAGQGAVSKIYAIFIPHYVPLRKK